MYLPTKATLYDGAASNATASLNSTGSYSLEASTNLTSTLADCVTSACSNESGRMFVIISLTIGKCQSNILINHFET